jgi:predicted lipoprotein with Yx(FWY)xxD motif
MTQMQHRRTAESKVLTLDRRSTWLLVILAAVLGVIGFLAASSPARSANESSATVSLRKTALGHVLVNSKGRTIYLFMKDKNGKSSCSGSCAQFWPPVVSGRKATVGAGLKASLLGTTMRSNGTRQVTYNRHPLYTFALDKRAGQTTGEGTSNFGAKWYAVSAKGRAVVKAPTASTSTTTPTTTTTPYPSYP